MQVSISQTVQRRIEKLLTNKDFLCVECGKRLRNGKKYCGDCQYEIELERKRNYYKFRK